MRRLSIACVLLLFSATTITGQTTNLHRPADRIYLDSEDGHRGVAKWEMKRAGDVTLTGEQLSEPTFSPNDWQPAIVPGTVLNSLVYNKVYPEPYYGMNNKIDRGLIPDLNKVGRDHYTYWFRTEFDVPSEYSGQTVWLDVEGINYHAAIYVNGHDMGRLDGMFQPKHIDISDVAIIGGTNALAIRVEPIDYPGSPSGNKDYGASGENHNGGDGVIGKNVTMLMSAGWDFTFYDGIRDRNTGIWKSVSIHATPGVRLDYPFVKSTFANNYTRASQTVSVEVTNPTHSEQTYTVEGLIVQGDIHFSKEVTIAPHTTTEVVFTPSEYPQLVILNPRLWWPIFKGEQYLYDLTLMVKSQISNLKSQISSRFGIREIKSDQQTPDKSRQFYVNGKKFFVRGTNWIPEGMLRCSDERTYAELRYTQQTGINFIRLWGGGIAESDYFYQLCDEMGFVVWQEFWLTADTNGKNGQPQVVDNNLYLQNVEATVKRLRNHACIGYWVAANEGTDISGTRELINKLDGTRGYQRQSETDGIHDGSPYKQVNPMRHYTNNASERGSRIDGFNPEYGAPAMPIAESLHEFMPENLLWPVGTNEWNEAWDYHDGNGFHKMSSLYKDLTNAYGTSSNIDEFAMKGQLVAAINAKTIWEAWNEQKLSYGDRYASGLLFWYHNCPVDQVCARFWDHSLEPTAMLYHTANALQPLHPQFDYKTNTVSVVNDYLEARTGLTLSVEIYNLQSQCVWSKEQKVDVPADGVANDVMTIPFDAQLSQVHFIKLRLKDASGQLVGDNFYWRSLDEDNGQRYEASGPCASGFQTLSQMPKVDIEWNVEPQERDGHHLLLVKVKNPTDKIAFFLQLQVLNGRGRTVRPTFNSDNFFTLMAGEERTIEIELLDSHYNNAAEVRLKGWNIDTKKKDLESYVDTECFYLFNLGQQKYVHTGGYQKQPDMPELVENKEDATKLIITPTPSEEDNGRLYLIADPDWTAGWGVQGRQVISISMNGAERTANWGSNYTPGWQFMSSPQGGLYITYTWRQFEQGNYTVEDPVGKTYALYFGSYSQSTDAWNRNARNEVKNTGIYGAPLASISQYGNDALWQVVPVGSGIIEALPYEPTGIMNPPNAIQTNEGHLHQQGYNLHGVRALPSRHSILITGGKKIMY